MAAAGAAKKKKRESLEMQSKTASDSEGKQNRSGRILMDSVKEVSGTFTENVSLPILDLESRLFAPLLSQKCPEQ